VPIERIPRMIASVEGLTSTGKTTFALRGTPRPVLLLDTDFGAEGLADDVLDGVERKQYDMLEGAFTGESEAGRAQIIKREVERFLADYRAAFSGGKYRTVVVDTASVIWSGLRLRHETYAEAEEVFYSLIRAAYKSTTNLTLIHHLTTTWARTPEGKPYKKLGVYERIGCENVTNKVQLAVRQAWVNPIANVQEGRFTTFVDKCRDNKALEGETLEGADWVTVCSLAVPSVDWSV
jgi:hypothetical protein